MHTAHRRPADESRRPRAHGRASVDLFGYREVRVRAPTHDGGSTISSRPTWPRSRPGRHAARCCSTPAATSAPTCRCACADDGVLAVPGSPISRRPTSPPRSLRYVLSSDVGSSDLTATRRLMALPGSADAVEGFAPSVIRPGVDVLLDDGAAPLDPGARSSGGRRGRGLAYPPRPGTHGRRLRRASLPAEAGLDATDRRREGVLPGAGVGRARPQPRASAPRPAAPAMRRIGGRRRPRPVMDADGAEAGTVTSAAPDDRRAAPSCSRDRVGRCDRRAARDRDGRRSIPSLLARPD